MKQAQPNALARSLWDFFHEYLPGASIMASATLCFSRWTQWCRRQLHRCQNRRAPRARLLTQKARCRRRPVRVGEEKVLHGGAALALTGQLASSQWMAA